MSLTLIRSYQRFGHHSDKCTKEYVCARCSLQGHASDSCENPICCFNCKGDHFANSKECPKWKQEKEIQSIKVLRNITFKEARSIVEAAKPSGPDGASYASKAKKTGVTVSVQTNITWPNDCKTYKVIEVPSDNTNVKNTTSTQSIKKIPDQTPSSSTQKGKNKPPKSNQKNQKKNENQSSKEKQKSKSPVRDKKMEVEIPLEEPPPTENSNRFQCLTRMEDDAVSEKEEASVTPKGGGSENRQGRINRLPVDNS